MSSQVYEKQRDEWPVKTRQLFLESEQALLELASCIAKAANRPLTIFLEGDLGAGKTTFARGFLRGCGYQGIVKSPTYTLVEPYSLDPELMCYHFDLYRLSDPEEIEFTGARDYFNGESTCLIEWPEKAVGFLPDPDLKCVLEPHKFGRLLSISAKNHANSDPMLQCFSNYLL